MSALLVRQRHAELIAKLNELYSIMVQLREVEPQWIRFPDAEHPMPIDREAALAAGYTEEAVAVMEQVPQIDVRKVNRSIREVTGLFIHDGLHYLPETGSAVEWTETWFKTLREYEHGRLYQDGDFDLDVYNDIIAKAGPMAPSIIRFTQPSTSDTALLYDTATCKMIAWNSSENPVDVMGFAHLPMVSPSTVLDPYIQGYRSFQWMVYPGEHGISTKDSIFMPDSFWRDAPDASWSEIDRTSNNRVKLSVERHKAMFAIKDIAVQCGWDVDGREQTNFDEAKYKSLWTKHMAEVVEPLEHQISELLGGNVVFI